MNLEQCKKCSNLLPFTSGYFQTAGGRKANGEPYLRYICKPCYTESKNNYKKDNRKRLNAWKLKASCSCGYSLKRDKENFSTRSLTFHHRDNNKVNNISDMMNYSWKNILKEINKCDVICFNCHMAIHGKE